MLSAKDERKRAAANRVEDPALKGVDERYLYKLLRSNDLGLPKDVIMGAVNAWRSASGYMSARGKEIGPGSVLMACEAAFERDRSMDNLRTPEEIARSAFGSASQENVDRVLAGARAIKRLGIAEPTMVSATAYAKRWVQVMGDRLGLGVGELHNALNRVERAEMLPVYGGSPLKLAAAAVHSATGAGAEEIARAAGGIVCGDEIRAYAREWGEGLKRARGPGGALACTD